MSIVDLFADHESATVQQAHVQLSPEQRSMRSIERVLREGRPCVVAWSSGKDSSCCMNLLLNAAINVMQEGYTCPPLAVSHSDTSVENPVVRALADGELAKIKQFADTHGIPLDIRIGKPTLAACFTTRVVGGRALPPFPGTNRDCSSSWKVLPAERNIRLFTADHKRGPKEPGVVTIIGTRSTESAARAINTAARKETAHEVWYSAKGEARLSPILDWSTDDVWTYIGECAAGLHPSYSDFGDVMDFYRDAGASSCVVVADMKAAASSKACGARGGCWTCTAVSADKSVENMLEQNPGKYPYLLPLLRVRDFMADTQYDWSRRNFIGRTIGPDGTIKVQADQYSPAMCEELLRYTLAAQSEANRLGAPAPVTAIGLREIIALDFFWSLRAWHPPFHALWVYFEHCAGRRKFAPKIERPFPPSPVPVIGDLKVGTEWDQEWSDLFPSGLRFPAWEMFSESCGPSLKFSPAGKLFLALDETPEFDVDEEAAADFIEFIAEEKIREMHRSDYPDWTQGALTYLQYGTVTINSGGSSTVDSMMRRSQWLQQHGLHGHQTAEMLRGRCDTLATSQAELFA